MLQVKFREAPLKSVNYMLLAKISVLKCILREILKNYQNCFDEIWENCSDPGVKKCLALATGLSNLAERSCEFKVDFLLWMFPLRESKSPQLKGQKRVRSFDSFCISNFSFHSLNLL